MKRYSFLAKLALLTAMSVPSVHAADSASATVSAKITDPVGFSLTFKPSGDTVGHSETASIGTLAFSTTTKAVPKFVFSTFDTKGPYLSSTWTSSKIYLSTDNNHNLIKNDDGSGWHSGASVTELEFPLTGDTVDTKPSSYSATVTVTEYQP